MLSGGSDATNRPTSKHHPHWMMFRNTPAGMSPHLRLEPVGGDGAHGRVNNETDHAMSVAGQAARKPGFSSRSRPSSPTLEIDLLVQEHLTPFILLE